VRRQVAQIAEYVAAFASTGASARALFCTLARLIYRQLCGLVQRPSETGAVIAHIGRCWSGDKATPGAVYDSGLFRPETLPKLAIVKLGEFAKMASCSKASASDIRSGKRTPHVSTWAALAKLVSTFLLERDANARSKTPASTRVTGDFFSNSVRGSVKMPTDAGARRELGDGRTFRGCVNEKGIQSGTRHSEVDNGYSV
jgi:hypothetical protein